MMDNSYAGKFIVIEGLDGSGKATQTKLLVERLEEIGQRVEKIDFPQYGTKSAGLIENYLNGSYGSSESVGPYRASVFFACDRYDASFKIKKWIKEGKLVISDRYIASNMGHQGGKIKDAGEREKYLKWLYDFEYRILGIPKPDLNIILKTSPEFSMKLSHKISDKIKKRKREAYLGDSNKQDIHERDKLHLINTLASYMKLVGEYPNEFKVIECLEENNLLPPNVIHEKIWKLIEEIL